MEGSLSLDCTVANACPSNLTWLIDGTPVVQGAGVTVTNTLTSSQLNIAAVTNMDFGTYTCVIANSIGSALGVAYVREMGEFVCHSPEIQSVAFCL